MIFEATWTDWNRFFHPAGLFIGLGIGLISGNPGVRVLIGL
jgi:hypothetical protein